MSLPLFLIALSLAAATPPAAPLPAPAASPPPAAPVAAASALSQLSAEARSKAARRAKFVYRLPDGTVWDSWLYCEFRDVLRDFDATPKDAEPTPRARAWGFKAGARRIHDKAKRPDPLWHTLADPKAKRPGSIYLNTAHATEADKGRPPMIEVGKEHAPRVFALSLRQFPKNEISGLPHSFGVYGNAEVIAFIPPEIRARPGEPLTGEFFFLEAAEMQKPEGASSLWPMFRVVHAAKLRLNPEQYAEALLAGEIEMIEWSFRRTSDRLGEKFEWTRRVVEAKADAGGGEVTETTEAEEPTP